MKKVVKLTESDLMNIIKKVIKESKPSASSLVTKLAGPGTCKDPMIVYTGNGCTFQCNGSNGWTAAQGSAVVGDACSNPPVPLVCACSKGGKTR
jgi:hypothetical protein